MKGRPRDPTRARRKTGNRPLPGELRVVRVEAAEVVPDWPPPAPADLPEGARKVWEALIGDLPHIARTADLEAFRMLCLASHRARRAGERIDQLGELVRGERGPMVNPLTKLERDATLTFIRLAEQLGLTTAARLRLGVVAAQGATLQQQLDEQLGRRV